MLIGNKFNSKIVVNTALVTDYFKGKLPETYEKTFIIKFSFAGEGNCVNWYFEKEGDRDSAWNGLMELMSVQLF